MNKPPRPPLRPDLETELLEFLQAQKLADTSNLVQRIWDQVNLHERKDEERHEEQRSNHAELRRDLESRHYELRTVQAAHDARISVLEKDAEKLEKKLDDTGSHNIAHLEKQLERAHESFFKKNGLVIGIIGLVLSAAAVATAIAGAAGHAR